VTVKTNRAENRNHTGQDILLKYQTNQNDDKVSVTTSARKINVTVPDGQ